MKPNAVLSADDGDPNTHNGEIDLTAGETLTVRSDAFGGYEVHLHAGGDVYLQASLDSGHLVDVQAGLGPTGVGSIITDINTDIATSGSEIHFKAGPNGGNLELTDAQIYTAGPIELSAPAGSLVHTGGRIIADSLSATVRDGITAHLDVRTIDATITGAGNLNLLTEGNVTLQSVTVTNGQVDVQGFGDVVAVNVKTLGGDGSITIGSYAGNLLLGTIQAAGGFTAEANVGEISGLPGGSIGATETQFQGQMTDNLNVVSDDITLISQFPGDVVINHPSTRPLTLRQVYVLDGSLIVHTLGDLIVMDAQLLTNNGEHHVELNAGGDVIVSNLIAGDYAATPVEADVLRAVRQLPADAPIRTLNDVTIVAGGAIREDATGDDAVDIVAKRLKLQAGGSISGIEIAANELPEVKSTGGSVTLVERDGVGETSLGLQVLKASAPAGGVTIAAAGSMLVTSVNAGAGGIKLQAQGGSLAVLDGEDVAVGLTSGGGIELSGGDLLLDGPLTASGTIAVVAGGELKAQSSNLVLTAANVSLDAQSAISLVGGVKANGNVSIISHAGDVIMSADIEAKPGGALAQV
ncbi:MAG TPA: hypothetical protein PLV92_20155, partial [Pirellulaceae bacterium]|nr:hypothetical protein [Pirellulaceae bacterium]